MPVTLHGGPSVNVFELHGRISPADFAVLKGHYLAHGGAAVQRDALYVIRAGADLSTVSPEALSAFKQELVEAFGAVSRHVVVRTAFVVREPSAAPAIAAWRAMSSRDDGLTSDVEIFPDLAQAADWLALSAQETEALKLRLAGPVHTR